MRPKSTNPSVSPVYSLFFVTMVLARAKFKEAMEERRNWAPYIASYCQQVIPSPYFSTEEADIDSKTENNGDKGREEVDQAIGRGAKAQWLDGCCRISL